MSLGFTWVRNSKLVIGQESDNENPDCAVLRACSCFIIYKSANRLHRSSTRIAANWPLLILKSSLIYLHRAKPEDKETLTFCMLTTDLFWKRDFALGHYRLRVCTFIRLFATNPTSPWQECAMQLESRKRITKKVTINNTSLFTVLLNILSNDYFFLKLLVNLTVVSVLSFRLSAKTTLFLPGGK